MAPVESADRTACDEFLGCAYCHEAFPNKRELEVHEAMTHPGQPFSSVPAPMPEREQGLLHKSATMAISRSIPLSEVNRHCTPEDCWVAINGKVYDLTEFMDRHPGGPTSVLNFAGKDASKIFNDIHKGVKIDQYLRPEAFLGDLGVDESLMSDEFWHSLRKARIEEVQEELRRLRQSSGDVHPSGQPALKRKASHVVELLQDKGLCQELKAKLQTLETQKRVALDEEDYGKAQAIKGKVVALLEEAGVETKVGMKVKEEASSGIPLSEVARHNKPHDCWVAVDGAVYDLTFFLQYHPEQRNAVLAWAGRDATPMWNKIPGRFPSATWMEFFMRPEWRNGDLGAEPHVDTHTEHIHQLEAELRRLEGPSEEDIRAARATKAAPAEAGAVEEAEQFPRLREELQELAKYARYKAADAAIACVAIYAYRSWRHRKPLSKLMYSRGLRHLHFIMAVGLFGTLGSARAAANSEGLAKKRYLQIHKQTGLTMLVALVVRAFLRLQSGIPPRFPGHPLVQMVETQSLRLFYLLALVLPVTGMANEYFLKWAKGDDAENDKRAREAITIHTRVGRFFERVWLPFHLGYTTAWHYSKGRGVVRKVSPFI